MTLTSDCLTLLATLKTRLGITGSTYDTILESQIKASSNLIVSFVGKKLHYDAAIVEKYRGPGTTEMVLRRRPLWHVTTVDYDGDTVSSDDYEVPDAQLGILLNRGGWLQDAGMRTEGVAVDARVDYDLPLYTVTYIGGWVTPNQSLPSPNTYSVEALPAEIEEACLMTASYLWAQVGSDPTVSSESLLSYSASYGAQRVGASSGLPVAVEAMLRGYQEIVQA